MLARIFLIITALSIAATAETFTYVIFRQKCFPGDKYVYEVSPLEEKKFVDAGKKTIDAAKGQPFRMTTYQLNFDGKYALLNIDDEFESPQSKGYLRAMRSNGCAVLISTAEVVSVYEPRIGGSTLNLVYEKLGEYPTDYYYVGESSTT